MDESISQRAQTRQKPEGAGKSTKRTWSPSLVKDVTKENWAILAGGFMSDRGGVGFPLALARVRNKTGEYDATARQWGAWFFYLKAKGIPVWRYMRSRSMEVDGTSGEPSAVWTAPAEWPHLFDMDATVGDDNEAADKFIRGYRPPSIQMADRVKRIAQVQKMRDQQAKPPSNELKEQWT